LISLKEETSNRSNMSLVAIATGCKRRTAIEFERTCPGYAGLVACGPAHFSEQVDAAGKTQKCSAIFGSGGKDSSSGQNATVRLPDNGNVRRRHSASGCEREGYQPIHSHFV
jgi:hypothetical protein